MNWENTKHTGRSATYVVAASDAPAHVKAQADYVCDGTVADNVKIQAAIDAISGTKWETVKLVGSFSITTAIALESYLNLDLTEAIITAGANVDILTSANSKSHINILGGILDGNKTAGYTEDCIALSGTNGVLGTDFYLNVIGTEIRNAGNFGLDATNSQHVTFTRVKAHDNGLRGMMFDSGCYIWVTDCEVYSNGTTTAHYGIYFGNNLGSGKSWHDIHIHGLTTHDNAGIGLLLTDNLDTLSPYNADVNGVISYSNGNRGVLFQYLTRSTIKNIISYSNTGYGVGMIGCSYCDFSGIVTYSNTTHGVNVTNSTNASSIYNILTDIQTFSNTEIGLQINNTTHSTFKGVQSHGHTSPNYGIYEYGASSNNTYIGCDVSGNTYPFTSSGSGNIYQGNVSKIMPGEIRTASGSLTKTDYTFTTVTGTFTETGTQLKPGANTLHCTADGTAKLDIPTGCVAVAASVGGGATVADSPKTLVNNTAFAVTAGGTNEFTITITHIAFAWHDPEIQDILIKKIVVNITTKGGTATSIMDVGIADDAVGTNIGTEFFNDIDVDAAAAVHDSYIAGDGGTQTKWVLCQDNASATDGWVVGKIATEKADALAGSWYVEYVGK